MDAFWLTTELRESGREGSAGAAAVEGVAAEVGMAGLIVDVKADVVSVWARCASSSCRTWRIPDEFEAAAPRSQGFGGDAFAMSQVTVLYLLGLCLHETSNRHPFGPNGFCGLSEAMVANCLLRRTICDKDTWAEIIINNSKVFPCGGAWSANPHKRSVESVSE